MSLNGLEDAKVQEAFEAAVAEPGGWFLLKYASRDEVELLGRGNDGIVEVRAVIANYEEPSPLYGFLSYRRRKVILKYTPEDCSRLVKARSAVHYNAVCERFSPYDTTFETSVAKDLKDSKLSAACSLHAASASSSSSNSSLRRRRLNEIAEEEEEERERKRQSIVQEERLNPLAGSQSDTPISSSTPAFDPNNITTPPDTTFSSLKEPPNFNGVERPTSATKSESDPPRLSSQTSRSEFYSYATYTYGKPKMKLGPRPSLDANRRPHTASNIRPVAALPTGFKGFSKGSKKGKAEDKISEVKVDQSEEATTEAAPPTLEVPTEDEDQQLLPPRPVTSSGASMKSVAASIAPSVAHSMKESKMTPEKARLMKAMKMREKKKKMAALAPADSVPSQVTHNNGIIEEEAEAAGEQSKTYDGPSAPHSDSGISVDPLTPISPRTDARSCNTTSDSHPPSPTAASLSEMDNSTKASSLSESTDETVQANTESVINDSAVKDVIGDGIGESSEIVEGSNSSPVETVEAAPVNPKLPPEDPQAETLEKEEKDVADEATITTSISQESQQIPEPHQQNYPLQTTEVVPESSRDADDSIDVTRETGKLRTTGLDTIVDEDESPKSALSVPRSRFSTSEARSTASPSSTRSPVSPTATLRSKFSTRDNEDASQSPPSISVAADTSIPESKREGQGTKEIGKDDNKDGLKEEGSQSLLAPPKSARRQAGVRPIHTGIPAKKTPQSEVSDPLLDDALMEELQSATVEQARPMVVSKSPITPVFPPSSPLKPSQDDNTNKPSHPVRTASNPVRSQYLPPADVSQSSARSVSAGGAAFLHSINRQPSNAGLQPKKVGVGSSISQRIKALEKLSGGKAPEAERPKTAAPTASFYNVRRASVRQHSRAPSLAGTADSLSRVGSPTPDQSTETAPEDLEKLRRRSGSMANRLSMFEGQVPNVQRGRPESIQVTARILRDHTDDSTRSEIQQSPTDFGPVELKESPLIIDVRNSEPEPVPGPEASKVVAPEPQKETLRERRFSRDIKLMPEDDEKQSRRPSLGIVKDFIKDRRTSVISKSSDNLNMGSPGKVQGRPPSSQSNFGNVGRRMSTSSHHSPSHNRDNSSMSPLTSPTVASDASGDDEKAKDKKSAKDRASQFMRRLSNSLAVNRKNTTANIAPTLTEEPADQTRGQTTATAAAPAAAAATENPPEPTVSAYMGDVNVQFPDNLLWKRRSMCLDSQGWLILSAVQGAASRGKDKTGVKRYHLSEFCAPYAPDVEVEELPNSVRLDLVAGSCLQIACESRHGQMNALRSLQDAHRSHTSIGQ
ncbi:hypothetical protein DL764_010598 [Monosporascus ibericus]|uniref:ADF-H domain-containing protein n=1 Tax=Monosporascus ibericus TaxID=155417 RepID=A0A4Q4SV29_9PEZI|nr:hypothetical protein DL764_010598 [Monosporascus ibericus]